MYDVSEQLITGEPRDSPLASLTEQERVQINVRRPRGDDIQAACGQLQGEEAGRERRRKRRAEAILS